jgi:TonB family protein
LRNRKLGGIFVSYRRSDSQGEAGRLFDDLVQHFGEATVFMDVAAIEAGRDFRKAIEEGVTKCGVLLVVIGSGWLDAKDERGARRLDDPSDFVRIETASALKRDIPVIPVLVRGARMPSSDQLPEELKELAYRNCMEVSHARWKSDMQLLTEALRRLLGDSIQIAASAKPGQATSPARPSASQEEVTAQVKLEEESTSRIDPAAVQQVTRELAVRIGPIAGIVVRRAVSRCNSVEDLYLKVAGEIDSRDEREKFLQGRAPIAAASAINVRKEAILASNSAGAARLPAPSEQNDMQPKTVRPATGMPLSNQRKNLLLASAGGVFLILLLVLVARFAAKREAGTSHPSRTSDQATRIPPAGMPAKSDMPVQLPATSAAVESQPNSPLRVHLSEEVSNRLLIKTILPVYPILAKQAHIQGKVVLDADISKTGAVETLKVISGDPLLIQSALNAAKQWRYRPYVRNGEPVEVNTRIVVGFTLSGG